MDNPKFVLFTGEDNQYYFRLQAANGEPILQSEGYKTKAGADNGIESVKENATKEERYVREQSKDGQYYFNLRAANHEIIGVSEMYTTTAARDNGIAAVKDDAPGAPIDDRT